MKNTHVVGTVVIDLYFWHEEYKYHAAYSVPKYPSPKVATHKISALKSSDCCCRFEGFLVSKRDGIETWV